MRNGDKITTGTCKLSHPVEIVGVQKQLKRGKKPSRAFFSYSVKLTAQFA